MIKKIRIFLVLIIIQLITNTPAMGKSMQIDEPFYKVYFEAEGVIFGIVINGFEAYFNNKGGPITLEMPINQFVKSGKNKLELQLQTWEVNNKLSIRDTAYINIEYRLYISLDKYVVLNKLAYSAKNEKLGQPFKDTSEKGQYSIIEHELVYDITGEYNISDFQLSVDKENYDANYIYNIVTMPTPFPEWRFLSGDIIPDPKQFETDAEIIDGLIGAPFNEIKKIHTALMNKNIDTIMPLFKERNAEMDKAYYYEPGTYEKLLKEAFQEDFTKGRILNDLDINIASPTVSPGKNVIQLGLDPLIVFHNKSKSIFIKYDIFFRKDGDKWIITR